MMTDAGYKDLIIKQKVDRYALIAKGVFFILAIIIVVFFTPIVFGFIDAFISGEDYQAIYQLQPSLRVNLLISMIAIVLQLLTVVVLVLKIKSLNKRYK